METFLEVTKLLSMGAFLLMSVLIAIIFGALAIDLINKHIRRK